MTQIQLLDKAHHVRRRSNYAEVKDDFPTPPWVVRAFFKYVAPELIGQQLVVKEPAAGRGHMVKVLKEQRLKVEAADLIDYGVGFKVEDYLAVPLRPCDVVLTNPPYRYANEFTQKALKEARVGVAMLLRTLWLESTTRYNKLFSVLPPTRVAVFSRRMQAAQGRVVRQNGAMFSHSWFWWDLTRRSKQTQLAWLPPMAQAELDRDDDHD